MSDVTPVRIVGSTKRPFTLPPSATFAPFATASSICSFTLAACLSLISGPMMFALSRVSPTFSLAARSTKRRRNSSYTFSCTSTFSTDMQICPWCMKLPKLAAALARSRSASSHTMSASLPPSSRQHFFRWAPARAAIWRPTAVEPVKASTSTSLCRASALPTV